MKKFFLSLGLLLALATVQVKAANVTYVLLPNGITNTLGAPILVTKVVLSANGTNSTIQAVDSPTNTLTLAVAAYTNITTYATNLVVSWTNFFGAVNSYTNVAQIQQTNSNASSTVQYARPFAAATAASTTTTIDDASYFFLNGVLLTNNSSGTVTITLSYQK
jgi:hypothetical protein